MASAPPMDLEYFQDQLKYLEKEKNNLNLALIQSELEHIIQEVSKLHESECDEQCQKPIEEIESHTLDEFLKKSMNDIFKEK
jgi:hypothetical protein